MDPSELASVEVLTKRPSVKGPLELFTGEVWFDVIVDDELRHPETFDDMRGLYAWGPVVPAEFLLPDDVAELVTAG